MINKNFQNILQRIKRFRDAREWMQFHNPKDMAQAISIEAGELQELFLWKNDQEIKQFLKDKKNKNEVADELADIFNYAIELADNLGIDIEKAIENKFKKSEIKYPVNKSKGKSTKWTKL